MLKAHSMKMDFDLTETHLAQIWRTENGQIIILSLIVPRILPPLVYQEAGYFYGYVIQKGVRHLLVSSLHSFDMNFWCS